jgi:hypothetical protein
MEPDIGKGLLETPRPEVHPHGHDGPVERGKEKLSAIISR